MHYYRAGADSTITPLKWMAIRSGYNFDQVNSKNEDNEYDEHRGMISFTLTPSQPYHRIAYFFSQELEEPLN